MRDLIRWGATAAAFAAIISGLARKRPLPAVPDPAASTARPAACDAVPRSPALVRLPPRPRLPAVQPSGAEDLPLAAEAARPPGAVPEWIVALPDWDLFLAAIRPMNLDLDLRIRVIVERIRRQANLGREDADFIVKCLREEDEDVTRIAGDRGIGSGEVRRTMALISEKSEMLDRIRDIRSEVRAKRTPELRGRVGDTALALVDCYLRTDAVVFLESFDPGAHVFLIRSGGE